MSVYTVTVELEADDLHDALVTLLYPGGEKLDAKITRIWAEKEDEQ